MADLLTYNKEDRAYKRNIWAHGIWYIDTHHAEDRIYTRNIQSTVTKSTTSTLYPGKDTTTGEVVSTTYCPTVWSKQQNSLLSRKEQRNG